MKRSISLIRKYTKRWTHSTRSSNRGKDGTTENYGAGDGIFHGRADVLTRSYDHTDSDIPVGSVRKGTVGHLLKRHF